MVERRGLTGPVTLAVRVIRREERLQSTTILVLQIVSALGVFALMFHVLANVVARYLFASPITGTLEWVQYWYMPISIFVGFVLAKQAKQMIEAPLLFDSLTWGNQRILVTVNNALVTAMCLLLTYFSFTGLALHGFIIKDTGGVSGLQIWPVYFVVPAVFLGLAGMYAWDTVQGARGRFNVPAVRDELEAPAQSEISPGSDGERDSPSRRP